MAITLIRKIEEKPLSIVSDGTNCYVGTNRGRILQIVISSKVKTTLAIVRNANITALCSDGTYLYAGDDKGRLTRVTIATGAKSILEANLKSPIISISHNGTTRYLGLANGKVASRA